MNKERSELQLNNIGLFKIFSNLDTQSAIVAAIAISITTFLASGFIDLCNYIYWSAYFTEFKIPMAYFSEAIIHEDGIKYTAVLLIPVMILLWCFLGMLKSTAGYVVVKIKERFQSKRFERHRHQMTYAEKIVWMFYKCLFYVLVVMGLIAGFAFVAALDNMAFLIFYFEFGIFVLWHCCKATLGKKFSLEKKPYYLVRIIGIIVLTYMILGNVYYAGSMENYSRNSTQMVKVVNNSDGSYQINENGEKITQLVLLETADYYYVTDVIISDNDEFDFQIVNTDSYRFIDKVDCPVKSVYANLKYIRGRHIDDVASKTFGYFMTTSLISVLAFVSLFSIPMKKKETQEQEEDK